METTYFLGKVLGLYLVIMSIFVLLHRQTISQLIQEFSSHKALMFLSGIITLLLGLMMVVAHNIWVWDWRVIITIFGWLILIAGVLRIYSMEKMMGMSLYIQRHMGYLYTIVIIYLVIGLFLIYKVWF